MRRSPDSFYGHDHLFSHSLIHFFIHFGFFNRENTMTTQSLSSRGIMGNFYTHLEQDAGFSWMNHISMLFTSDQSAETYAWLGQSPVMREWTAGRQAKRFNENKLIIHNRHFEATVAVMTHELRRDKTGQILVRIQELAERTNAHWASLLSQLMIEGETEKCYDGQAFFSTDHQEGKSGKQSNLIAVDQSKLGIPKGELGSEPNVKVMKAAILKGVRQILGVKDDQGEPFNENAKSFLALVPTNLMDVVNAAISSPVLSGAETNDLALSRNFSLDYAVNSRLPWDNQFMIFRTDGSVAPFIRQEEMPVKLNVIGDGSEEEFKEGRHLYGVDCWRNVGYGYWQKACLVKMV
jgi:phage major head subunit gpT-like protein